MPYLLFLNKQQNLNLSSAAIICGALWPKYNRHRNMAFFPDGSAHEVIYLISILYLDIKYNYDLTECIS